VLLALGSSETPVNISYAMWRHIPGDSNLQSIAMGISKKHIAAKHIILDTCTIINDFYYISLDITQIYWNKYSRIKFSRRAFCVCAK
jgi:hypothetical protein